MFPAFANFRRTANEDIELNGTAVCEGDKVLMWYVSSNRDESRYADPDRFDIPRNPEHQAFGAGGRHFCLGAALARLELHPVRRDAGPLSESRARRRPRAYTESPVRQPAQDPAGASSTHPVASRARRPARHILRATSAGRAAILAAMSAESSPEDATVLNCRVGGMSRGFRSPLRGSMGSCRGANWWRRASDVVRLPGASRPGGSTRCTAACSRWAIRFSQLGAGGWPLFSRAEGSRLVPPIGRGALGPPGVSRSARSCIAWSPPPGRCSRVRVQPRDEITTEDGILVTTVARTLLDLASVLDRDRLAQAVGAREAPARRTPPRCPS